MTFHPFMSLCVFTFVFAGLKFLQNVFLKLINIFVSFVFILVDAFGFFYFLVPSQQRNNRNLFTVTKNIFVKENFCAPTWTSVKFYCGNKTGNLEQAVLLHLALSGSQSQHGIFLILPAHRASHIINLLHVQMQNVSPYMMYSSKSEPKSK